MASLNQIVGILAERSGRTFDIPFQEELKVLVAITGAKFMKDSLTKKPLDRRYYLQSLVLPVERISKIQCPISYGCQLRTVDTIPTPLRTSGIIFDFVGSADMEIPFAHGGDWKETYFRHNKYTAKNSRYVYRDNHLFIKDDEQAIEYIGIQYIPEDPLALRGLRCDNSSTCIDDDYTLLIPGDLLEPIVTSILTTKLGVMPPKDKTDVKVDDSRGF